MHCNSSNYSIGSVLFHVMPNGNIKPIAYASRTLSRHEKNYSQIMKEALATGIVFGVNFKYFH